MNTRVISAIVIAAATLVGTAILLISSLQQQASAQGLCEERGPSGTGALVRECDIGGLECHQVFTPSGAFFQRCR
jgi:hypothetical protein